MLSILEATEVHLIDHYCYVFSNMVLLWLEDDIQKGQKQIFLYSNSPYGMQRVGEEMES